jgi:hypothetical protein
MNYKFASHRKSKTKKYHLKPKGVLVRTDSPNQIILLYSEVGLQLKVAMDFRNTFCPKQIV